MRNGARAAIAARWPVRWNMACRWGRPASRWSRSARDVYKRQELLDFLRASKPEIFEHIVKEQKFTEAIETELNAAIETFKLQFSATA